MNALFIVRRLQEEYLQKNATLESKGMNVNINKTKLMLSGTERETSRSKIDFCDMCGKRVIANSVMCTKCRSWVHRGGTKKKKRSEALAQIFFALDVVV